MDSYVISIGCIRNDVDFNLYTMKQEGKFAMIVLYIDNTMLVNNGHIPITTNEEDFWIWIWNDKLKIYSFLYWNSND